jgi:nucleoside-diphosphate-sugar epimerase
MARLRVLVTGGCGFLGAYVARDLISHGHDVTVADIGGSGLLHEIVGGDLGPEAVPPVIRLDVSDATGLLRLAQEWQVTAIVHLAALLSPECQRAPMQGVLANLAGTASVFETAIALGISRVVSGKAPGPAPGGGSIHRISMPCTRPRARCRHSDTTRTSEYPVPGSGSLWATATAEPAGAPRGSPG